MAGIMINRKIQTVTRGCIHLPASKSISNRALIIRELCGSHPDITNLSEAGDTLLLKSCLDQLRETGTTGEQRFDVGNAGTVMRFLTALLSIRRGTWIIDGNARMRLRPVGELVNALRKLGTPIDYLKEEGFPPLRITGGQLRGGEVEIDAGISSQFISALLMTGPLMPDGLSIILKGNVVSRPYIDMTISLMDHFGITVIESKANLCVKPGNYIPVPFHVEADWSAASFFYEIAALSGNADIFLPSLTISGLQGDSIVAQVFENFGMVTTYENNGVRISGKARTAGTFSFDFRDCPDLAPAVIITSAALNKESRFTGIDHLRIKETDRLEAVQAELSKMGVSSNVLELPYSGTQLIVRSRGLYPGKSGVTSPSFNTYDDHRMAMALAPLATVFGQVQIDETGVVTKSFPGFWNEIKKLGYELTTCQED